jgi:C4-dicarboxylate-specific signal transduction histidine kinase
MSESRSHPQILLEKALDPNPLILSPDTPVLEAITIMSQANASYTSIVDQQKLIGIFTQRDIINIIASQIPLEGVAISQVMTENVITLCVERAHNLFDILSLLRSHQIHHLPLLNQQGDYMGIITQSSLLSALDPVEMYATITQLQQTLKTQNQELQQSKAQKQQAEQQLQKAKENLEQQVKTRTQELTLANARLAASNQELKQALDHLKITQLELIQSEKMAVLGQLIAGVAHEINTPLATLRSSVRNIAEFLAQKLEELPTFFQYLSPDIQPYFFALLSQSAQQTDILSSKEKRQLKKTLQHQLQAQGIAEPESLAQILISIGIQDNIAPFLPLLKDPNSKIILKMAYEFATVQRSTRIIAMATDQAAKVVLALKKYAHYDCYGEKIPANITEGIETVLTLYHNQIKQGIDIIKNYQTPLPLILCYPDDLNQVWTNLIHNALQAMNYRGILKIDVVQQEQNVLVTITDNGVGIPPEILPKIFDPFFTTKPVGEGSGLGLDIVKKIVDKHQGKIQVHSELGQTTFTVFLPISEKTTNHKT